MKSFVYKLPQESQKNNFIFNMIGSLANALVSLVLMIVVSYVTGDAVAGVFSIAYSTAQMMYTICVFEMRNIQVTDAKREFSFEHIAMFRLITIAITWIFFAVFVVVRRFERDTILIMIAITIYMTFSALSDLFQGNLHRNGYLSIAGKSLACQVLLMAVAFSSTLIITKNLLYAVAVMPIAVIIWIFVYDVPYNNNFAAFRPQFDLKTQKNMFLCALPLFLASFLHQYIFNSPKYAIELTLNKIEQAHYGYLVMPVFVINLLSLFVFRPQLITLSSDWVSGNIKSFKKMVVKLYLWVVLVTVAALLGGYLLGIPVLELLYNTNLSDKRSIFMVLLLSGGFSAASTLTLTLFTTMRKQVLCLVAYGVTTAFALVAPDIMTKQWGLMGAALSYLCEMVLLFAVMFVLFVININRGVKNEGV